MATLTLAKTPRFHVVDRMDNSTLGDHTNETDAWTHAHILMVDNRNRDRYGVRTV